MADGRIFKPEKDFTKETDTQIPEAQELAKVALPQFVFLTDADADTSIDRTMFKQPSKSLAILKNPRDR